MKFFTKILALLFPPECLGCGKEDFWICTECIEKIITEKVLAPYHLKYFEKVFVCSGWENTLIQTAVKKLKFQFAVSVLDDLRPFLEHRLKRWNIPENAILVPVPLHFFRKNKRGFNQSELMARMISEIEFQSDRVIHLLKRTRNTPHQSHLSKEDRIQNVAHAFSVNTKIAQVINLQTPIIIIDDVFTTGNTLLECGKALKEYGFEKVWAIVIAHGK